MVWLGFRGHQTSDLHTSSGGSAVGSAPAGERARERRARAAFPSIAPTNRQKRRPVKLHSCENTARPPRIIENDAPAVTIAAWEMMMPTRRPQFQGKFSPGRGQTRGKTFGGASPWSRESHLLKLNICLSQRPEIPGSYSFFKRPLQQNAKYSNK